MPRQVEVLAMTGAATIVAAMATDGWGVVRDQVAEFFERYGADRRAELIAQLDANAALVGRARDPDRARRALVGLWELELEEILTGQAEAAGDLGELVARTRAALPVPGQQFVQYTAAHDHGLVMTVQHGSQHIHYMDSETGDD